MEDVLGFLPALGGAKPQTVWFAPPTPDGQCSEGARACPALPQRPSAGKRVGVRYPYTVKLEPQPQLPLAFGFFRVKPAPMSPST